MIDDSPVEADWTAGELRQRLRNVISTMLGAIESGEAGAQMRDVTLCIADLALACANLKDERYDCGGEMLRALWVLISGLRLWWDYRRLRRLGLSDEAIKALIRRRLPEEFPDTSQADVEMALRIFRGK